MALMAHFTHSASLSVFSLTMCNFRSSRPIRRSMGMASPVAASYRETMNGASPQVISSLLESIYCRQLECLCFGKMIFPSTGTHVCPSCTLKTFSRSNHVSSR